MSEFEPAVNLVLRREGELSENPHDLGGITKFGISLRFLRSLPAERLRRYSIFEPVTEQTIRDLELPQAKFIYQGEFWDEAPFEEIESQSVCNYLFDMSVNIGTHQAIKLLQRAICAAGDNRRLLRDDGLMGRLTLGYVNSFGEALLPILISRREDYYRLLVAINPSQEVNFDDWCNRCYSA